MATIRADLDLKENRPAEAMSLFQAAGYALRECDPERSASCFVSAAEIGFQRLGAMAPVADKQPGHAFRSLRVNQIAAELELAVSTYEGIAQKLDDFRLWVLVQRQENAFRLYTDVILGRDGPGAALEVVERGKGRALRLAMHRRLAGHRTSAFSFQRLMQNAAFDAMLHMPAANVHLSPERLEQAFVALGRAVERKEPEIARLGEQQLRKIAADLGTPVVEYAFGTEEVLHCWVLANDDLRFGGADSRSDSSHGR